MGHGYSQPDKPASKSASGGSTKPKSSNTSVRKRPKGYRPSIQEQKLLDACELGHRDKVAQILEENQRSRKKLRIECENAIGSTPLKLACREGHLEVVRLLLESTSAEINTTGGLLNGVADFFGGPIYQSCKNQRIECVFELLSYARCDVNQTTDKYHVTPVMQATLIGSEALVRIINLSSKPDYLPWDLYCRSDYNYLRYFEIKSIIKTQLSSASDLSTEDIITKDDDHMEQHSKIKSKKKRSSFSQMISINHSKSGFFSGIVTGSLIKSKSAGYSIDDDIMYPSREVELHHRESRQGLGLLHSAAWHNYDDKCMRRLLNYGVSGNECLCGKLERHNGNRPLHRTISGWTSADHKCGKVRCLLSFGADPHLKDKKGYLPIEKARSSAHINPRMEQSLLHSMQNITEDKPFLS